MIGWQAINRINDDLLHWERVEVLFTAHINNKKPHCEEKTILPPFYFPNGIFYIETDSELFEQNLQ